jgi:DnaJ family protein C protein 16
MRIAKAYETLSDPEKRRIYDQVGDEGVKQHEQQEAAGASAGAGGFPGFETFRFSSGGAAGGGAGGGFDPFMIFEQMFGSRGFPQGGPGGGARAGRGRGGPQGGGGNLFEGTDVELITAQNAKSIIGKDVRRQDGRVWTIMFFANWCGHCQQTKPHFSEFAKRAKGVMRVGAVDCEASQSLCAHYKVQGYPTILSLMPDSSDPVPYNSQRTAEAFYEHTQRLIPSKSVTVAASEEQAKAVCDKNAAKACVVVLSDKPTPTPLVKALAYRLKDSAQTILVKVANPRKSPVFGSKNDKAPAIFVNGELYKGLLRMDDIYKFASTALKKSKSAKSKKEEL